jgi:tetratricopeptide (TPR) repeat protein
VPVARLEPRPPAKARSPLSPATLEILRRLGGGRGGLLFLTGEDRTSRTGLLRAVAARAEELHLETVRLRAHPLDRLTPYGALNPWFARWYQRAPEGPRRAGDGLDASFFTALAGLIETSSGSGPSRSTSDHGSEVPVPPVPPPAGPPPLGPEEMRAELLALVEGRSKEGHAVVTLQDAEFLDPAGREWLSFLGGRLGSLPLVVVLSLDPHAAEFEKWRAAFSQVTTTWERWPAEPTSRRSEPAPLDVVRKLPTPSRELAAVVGLAGPDARAGLVREVLGVDQERMEEAARPCIEAGIIEREGELLQLTEPGLFPDLGGTLDPSRVLALRREVARVSTRQEGPARGPRLFRISEHWAATGDTEHGAVSLIEAALEAERWGSPELAEDRLTRALSLVQAEPTPRGRELEERAYGELAKVRLRGSNPAGAAEAFERALSLAKGRGEKPSHWASFVGGLATAQTRLGQDPEPLLTATLETIHGQSDDLEASLLSSLGFYYRERGRTQLATEVSERACELAERGGSASVKALAHLDIAEAYFFGGGAPELEKARAHLQRAVRYRHALEGTSEASLVPMILDALSHVELALGQAQDAVRYGDDALASARQVGTRTCLLQVIGNQAEVHIEVSGLVRAKELTEELRRQCDRFGLQDRDVDRQQLLLLEGRVAASRGAYGLARQSLERLAEVAEKAGTRYYLGQALAHLVAVSVHQGEIESARRYLRRLEREGVRKTLPGITLRHLEVAEARMAGPSVARP